MTISEDHWIEGVKKYEIPGGRPMSVRRCLVIHFTGGASAVSSIDYNREIGLSAHVYIDRDGTIYQAREFNRTCEHAGVSRWRDPKTGALYVCAKSLNSCSIGIELANAGEYAPLAKKWSKLPLLTAKHRNEKVVRNWEQFPDAQYAACEALSKALVARYNLDDVTGHDCVAPERKLDPGPAFPMRKLRAACGFGSTLPEVRWP